MTVRIYTEHHAELIKEKGYSNTVSKRVDASLAEALLRKTYPNIEELNVAQYIVAYLKANLLKINILESLLSFLKDKNIKRIISIGSGEAVLEYFLIEYAKIEKLDLKIYCTDLSDLHVRTSNRFFPELVFLKFDFTKDSVLNIIEKCGDVDAVISFGSFYVMNDCEFNRFLVDVSDAKIQYILDYHAGCIMDEQEYLGAVGNDALIEQIHKDKQERGIMFHGYARMPIHLCNLYLNAGWCECSQFTGLENYKFAKVFKRQ